METKIGKLWLVTLVVVSLLGSVMASSAAAQTTWTCFGQAATIVGTPGDDVLSGTSGVDVFAAREGNDVIRGLGGEDIICAGKGDDTIYGGAGFDIIFGAQGDDLIFSANGSSEGFRADNRGARMFGGAGNDTIHGSDRWDRMQGGLGIDTMHGYEGRDWIRAGAGADQVDGGAGIDDLHGGNGNDTIALTGGDTVRGGAGLDLCTIASGAADVISCGVNIREAPPSFPEPILLRSESFSGTIWDFKVLGLIETEVDQSDEAGRCYLLVSEITALAPREGTEFAFGSDHRDWSLQVNGERVYGLNSCDTSAAEALGYISIWDAMALPGTTVPVYQQFFIPSSETDQIEAILSGDPRIGNRIVSYEPLYLPYLPGPSVT